MAKDLTQQAAAIDAICVRASDAFLSAESFSKALTVAQSIGDLRAALTPEVMTPIMELMNTPLGFMTDQDPKRPSASNPQPKPYSMEVVRDCFIEARLRGFYPVNNEMNIIAFRFYGALSGFDRIVRNHKDVANFRDHYEVPRKLSDDGALVKVKAEWQQVISSTRHPALPKYSAQTLEREFAVRINRGMGTDAIVGKAKRKLLAAVYSRLTGIVTPEGDVTDATEHLRSASSTEEKRPDITRPEDLFRKK